MALEQVLLAVLPVSFTSDGTALGLVTIADTSKFKDKQVVYIQSSTVDSSQYQIKRILSPTQLIVGPVNNKLSINDYSNISAYKVVNSAVIGAAEQPKNALPPDKDHYSAVYESSPTNADRVIPVDPYGNTYGPKNPMPVVIKNDINMFVPDDYDDVKLAYDISNNLTQASFYLNSALIVQISLTYDINNNLVEAKRIV